MSGDDVDSKEGEAFDVVLMHAPTADGEGAQVLRARPGRIEAGEVRPMREGKPLSGVEVVSLTQRERQAPPLQRARGGRDPGTEEGRSGCGHRAGAGRDPAVPRQLGAHVRRTEAQSVTRLRTGASLRRAFGDGGRVTRR